MAVMEKNPPGEQTGTGMRRDIGVVGLLFASVGSIIGSGWLFGALKASTIAGPAAIFSWLIGAVMIILIGLTYAELGTMFPLSGGVIRFPHLSFGSFASYSMGWVNWVAAAAVAPIEVEGALQYATKYAPLTSYDKATDTHPLTGLGYVIAVIAMAAFVLINYFGVRWFARVNNVAVWWKLGMITLVVVAFMVTEFHGSNFTSHGFATDGAHGMLTAIATGGIVFSYLGFRQGIELAGESSNPRRNIPIAVIGSVLITGVIYILLQVAFIAALDPGALTHGWGNLSGNLAEGFGPLAFIASAIGLGWLATLLYIDAIISPGDTGLIYTTVTGRLSYAMARNGNAPRILAKVSARGVPMPSLFLAFVVGLIMFLPFPSWQQLVSFITSATVLSFGSGPIVLARDAPADPRARAAVPRPVRRRHPVPRLLRLEPGRLLGRLGHQLEAVRRGRARFRAARDLPGHRHHRQARDELDGGRQLGAAVARRTVPDQLDRRLPGEVRAQGQPRLDRLRLGVHRHPGAVCVGVPDRRQDAAAAGGRGTQHRADQRRGCRGGGRAGRGRGLSASHYAGRSCQLVRARVRLAACNRPPADFSTGTAARCPSLLAEPPTNRRPGPECPGAFFMRGPRRS
ncbi:APC family permease [Jatrophihabitans cynanchi]|uniref:APC family permease n=1 Tax=Jatrophihabitans cynanchi TaxID=2944128 RepID=A0ABY7K1R7_9ACTN|nr:APC family permease [Jatrophihabitans sp. SB3-54]WAX58767.1 APC family permease [Jatrophihabitans sp. SB3-54]